MATRRVTYKGKDYDVVAEPHGRKFITRIDPTGGATGRHVQQPDTQTTDPATGKTTTRRGEPLESDTEEGALDVGEDNVKAGMI